MACDTCRQLDLQALAEGKLLKLHPNFTSLVQSATRGCNLCEFIRQGLQSSFTNNGYELKDVEEFGIACQAAPGRSWIGPGNPFPHLQFKSGFFRESSWVADFEIGVFSDQAITQPICHFISGRPIAPHAYSESCFELARHWLQKCLTEHGESCPQFHEPILPTRVIDIGPVDREPTPYLLITNGKKGSWVALSHCWGLARHYLTTSTTLPERQLSIHLSDLPQSFRDAIIITRRLGFQYVWIDSLCIIQGNHEDWVSESTQMQRYYKEAIFTLAASCAKGDEAGFLKPRDPMSSLTVDGLMGKVHYREKFEVERFKDRIGFLAKRGWALQEHVLSVRTLNYTATQIVWECQAYKYCESDISPQENDLEGFLNNSKRFFLTPDIGRERFPDSKALMDPMIRWYTLVSDYVVRDLTVFQDRLPAISGIAREMCYQSGYTYLAGLWVEDLNRGLLWNVYGDNHLPVEYRAPSWSWASLGGDPADLMDPHGHLYYVRSMINPVELDSKANLIGYHLELADNDPYGRVTTGWITLRGLSLALSSWRGTSGPYFNARHERKPYKSHYLSGPRATMASSIPKPDQLICFLDYIPLPRTWAKGTQDVENNEEAEEEGRDGHSDENKITKKHHKTIGETVEDENGHGNKENSMSVEYRSEDALLLKEMGNTILLRVSTWDWSGNGRCMVSQALILIPEGDTFRRVGIAEVPHMNGLEEQGWEWREFKIV